MNKVMIFDEKTKTRMGILCFTPVVCFLICFLYYMILILPLTEGYHEPSSMIGIISRNYDTLFIMLATSAIITAPIFIYCLVILARLKKLNAAMKLQWILFLSVLAPIASALFWIFLIKDSRKYQPIYPDIT